MATGTIKWFDAAMSFGFIIPDDGGVDVFFHLSKLKEPGAKVEAGYIVNYTLGKKAEKQFAFDVTVVSSDAVKGFDRHPNPKTSEKPVPLDAADQFEQEWGLRRA